MQEDDDFSNFNPKKHWAEQNNEIVSASGPALSDMREIDRMAKYLLVGRQICDIIKELKLPRGRIIRLFGLMRDVKNVSLERKEEKGILTYRVIDFRKSRR